MAKKPQTQKEPLETEDELLDFDLEELSGDETLAEDEVIELVELVEADKDEDKTRELTVKSRGKEKPPVKAAKALPIEEAETSQLKKGLPADEEEIELDLSDLTLDMDGETKRPVQSVGDDEITEADLENLLQETSDEEIAFELPIDEEGDHGGKEEEVTDADLEALLQEATAEDIEETLEEKKVQLEEEKTFLTDLELEEVSFEQTQEVMEAAALEDAPPPVRAKAMERVVVEEPEREEIAPEKPSVEKLTGISEERLEEIITKVVQDVVERVARETMAVVAERVIGRAIEALKMSMETSSEES